MADLVFKKGIDTTSNAVSTSKISDGVLQFSGISLSPRAVVRVLYVNAQSIQRGLYAIATSSTQVSYDANIYNVEPSSFSSTVYVYNSDDIHEVPNYRMGIEVENGLYSKAYLKYNSSTFYTLEIPTQRNYYFGSVSELITAENLVFADYCKNIAYGVGVAEFSSSTLNNKFKSTLEFNIATL